MSKAPKCHKDADHEQSHKKNLKDENFGQNSANFYKKYPFLQKCDFE